MDDWGMRAEWKQYGPLGIRHSVFYTYDEHSSIDIDITI